MLLDRAESDIRFVVQIEAGDGGSGAESNIGLILSKFECRVGLCPTYVLCRKH